MNELAVIRRVWPNIVGQQIAAVATPCAWDWSHRLTLSVSSNAWAAEIRALEQTLIRAVNAMMGGFVVVRKLKTEVRHG